MNRICKNLYNNQNSDHLLVWKMLWKFKGFRAKVYRPFEPLPVKKKKKKERERERTCIEMASINTIHVRLRTHKRGNKRTGKKGVWKKKRSKYTSADSRWTYEYKRAQFSANKRKSERHWRRNWRVHREQIATARPLNRIKPSDRFERIGNR